MPANQFLKSSDRVVSIVRNVSLSEDTTKSTDDTDDEKHGEFFKNELFPSSLSHMVDSFLPQLTQQIAFIECDVSLMSRGEIGNAGEAYAYAEFERAGYAVTRTGHRDKEGDLRVLDTDTGEVWRVEVKSMRRGSRGHYQACLRRQIKARVCTDAAHSQVVLLLAFPKVGAPIPFLIPQAVLMGRSQIVIASDPRTYAGKWAKFRTLDGLRIPNGEEDSSYG
jgi:Holliday junction resolvase-like predicted endonuclease